MTAASGERWPIDFDALERGSIVPAERIEEVYGVSRSDRNYSLHAMRLRDDILDYFLRERGEVVSAALDHDDLRIHTVPEQAAYTRRRDRVNARARVRNEARGLSVDLAKIESLADRRKHMEWQNMVTWRRQQLKRRKRPSISDGDTPQVEG